MRRQISATGRTAGELTELRAEVEEDARTLRDQVLRCGGHPAGPGAGPARCELGERVARLKPNGRLLRRSPLSDLIEVEGMLDAVRAKAAGWQALLARPGAAVERRGGSAGVYDRALSQAERLNTIHRTVAAALFTP